MKPIQERIRFQLYPIAFLVCLVEAFERAIFIPQTRIYIRQEAGRNIPVLGFSSQLFKSIPASVFLPLAAYVHASAQTATGPSPSVFDFWSSWMVFFCISACQSS